ncbi:MAG: hypothetical protein U1F45_05375 [Burkholderiales bacterium]
MTTVKPHPAVGAQIAVIDPGRAGGGCRDVRWHAQTVRSTAPSRGGRTGRAMTGAGRTATRVLILGAAGRDFHNFNVVHRDDARFEVA